ncbi:MAG: tetratricopeptide repeat protein [Gammaproteobacteria bacterium]
MGAKKFIIIIFAIPLFGFTSYTPSHEIPINENKLYLQAVAEDEVAQFQLANFYNMQPGILRKPGLAKNWYRAAALNGHIEAQNSLGLMYLEFNNFIEAKVWFESAAMQQHAKALLNLAEMYETGKGMYINKQKAHSLIYKAAELGDVEAMYKVSLNLTSGEVVKKDTYNGCVWIYRAENFLHSVFDSILEENISKQKQKCHNLLSKVQIMNAYEAANFGLPRNDSGFKKLMSLTN